MNEFYACFVLEVGGFNSIYSRGLVRVSYLQSLYSIVVHGYVVHGVLDIASYNIVHVVCIYV